MNIPERLIGPAVLVFAFAANAFHNHTALGAGLESIPGFYPIVFFIGVGAILPGLVLGRTVRRAPAAARPLGVTLGWRDALAALVALVIGGALAASPLAPIIGQPGGAMRVLTLFAQLMVASTAEVALFLGVMAAGLRAWRGDRDDWRSGLLLIVLSSLVVAVLFNNAMATVGFATRDLTLPLSPTTSVVIEILAIAAFVTAFSLARRKRTPSHLGAANG